jgi:ligand-binding SRPBCC domain-containing protein
LYYQFKREQILKTDINTIWKFASSPENLKIITPDYMNFKITTKDLKKSIYPGMIITYSVSPVFNFPMNWVTEITCVKDCEYFVDVQKMGPYKMWHHQHFFEKKNQDILMTDIVTYIPPFGILGRIANIIFIKNKLKAIFDYRENKMNLIFNN